MKHAMVAVAVAAMVLGGLAVPEAGAAPVFRIPDLDDDSGRLQVEEQERQIRAQERRIDEQRRRFEEQERRVDEQERRLRDLEREREAERWNRDFNRGFLPPGMRR